MELPSLAGGFLEPRNEDILERRLHDTSGHAGESRPFQRSGDLRHGVALCVGRKLYVNAFAKRADVDDVWQGLKRGNRASLIGDGELEHLSGETSTKRVRRVECQPLAFMQQGHAVAPFGFIEIGSAHQDGDALLKKLGEELPELAGRRVAAS